MSNESAEGGDAQVPDAVMEWLSSVAAERGQSEAELLQSLLAGSGPDTGGGSVDDRELDRVEREFRDLVQDVRERIVQVKRETDDKAPADHSHHDLRNSLEQLGREVGGLEAAVDQLDGRLSGGFENYEEILTYLTDTTDELNRRLGRLASAVIGLREQVGEAARDEVRRTALAHLTDTANRHGIDSAKCEDCGEAVDLSLLIEPRCPHCESSFSTIEPKGGFFRSSVLHTGTVPALESAGEAPETADDALEMLVDDATSDADSAAPDIGAPEASPRESPREADRSAVETGDPVEDSEATPSADGADRDSAPGDQPADETEAIADDGSAEAADAADDGDAEAAASDDDDDAADGAAVEAAPTADGDLQSIDGVGPRYADRLQGAGIDGLLALAVAEPEELAEAIDVPESTVADWVEQADARTSAS
jgi:predicted flap endonuclease-1-like 5' DNA nuclease/predicted Zn-ribbon and HTH transcriptional regulator